MVFTDAFQGAGHWIAFVLLAAVRARMLLEGLRREPGEPEVKRMFLFSLLVSALATGIDAAVAGLTIPAGATGPRRLPRDRTHEGVDVVHGRPPG